MKLVSNFCKKKFRNISILASREDRGAQPDTVGYSTVYTNERQISNETIRAWKASDDSIVRSAYDIPLKGCSLPNSIYCPITKLPMKDPVMALDGYSYERAAITRWFKSEQKSPYTNARLPDISVIPNHNLRNLISEITQN